MKHELPHEPSDDKGLDKPPQKRWQLEQLVAALRVSREETHSIRRDGEARRAPSREALQAILDGLTEALFPRN
jgi:serine O-acetyltransferase